MTIGRSLGIAVLWLVIAGPFGALLLSINGPRLVSILQNQGSVTGVVARTDCAQHNTIFYRFEFAEKSFSGSDSGECSTVEVGQHIQVTFSTVKPTDNILGDPLARLLGEIAVISLGFLLFLAFLVWQCN